MYSTLMYFRNTLSDTSTGAEARKSKYNLITRRGIIYSEVDCPRGLPTSGVHLLRDARSKWIQDINDTTANQAQFLPIKCFPLGHIDRIHHCHSNIYDHICFNSDDPLKTSPVSRPHPRARRGSGDIWLIPRAGINS